ncbi:MULTISPECIES: MFS transporter [unclassified Rhodococcus (in: high G+C Gram-positive bacteria)]|uniref:MFS transporter n=1 Tax=unclassified Rhodococcus (in: high G+C Gram-positive bacteria) TaxID=192944 RepID=UPI00211B6E2D|nr:MULTISPECIES: MFS transporter [unclassified Rhodococcus (in: high G+C Gram-positive bacteria)]
MAGLLQAVFTAVRVLLSYRVLELGFGGLAIGVLTALYSLVPLLIAIPIGRLVDTRLLSITLRGGAVVTFAAVMLIGFATNLPALAVGSVILGIGNLLTMVAAQSYIPHHGAAEDFDRRFGTFSLWVSIGQTGGLPLAGVVASTSLHTSGAVFVMAAVAAAAAIVSWLPGLNSTAPRRDTASRRQRGSIRSMIADPGMRAAIFSSLMVLTAIDLVSAYLPLLGERLGWTVLTVTVILTARSVASVASRLFLPLLLDNVSRRALLISGTGVSALPIAALPISTHPAIAVLFMVVAGFFWGIAQPLTMTWVANLAPPGNRGSALSLRMTGNRLGQVFIPIAAGGVASVTGIGAVFVTTGALLSIAAATTWRNTHST